MKITIDEILPVIEKNFREKGFVEKVNGRIKEHDKEGFKNVVEGELNKLIDSFEELKDKLGHLASSVQYESSVFGSWLRFKLSRHGSYIPGHEDCKLTLDKGVYFEELHKLMPKQSNLLFSDDLEINAMVKFGGSDSEIISNDDKILLTLKTSDWKEINEDIENKIKDVRSFIIGESGTTSSLNKIIKDKLCNFLEKLLSKKNVYKKDELYKIFLFTFYYSICQQKMAPPIYHIIIPFNVGGKRLASYCGAFKKNLTDDNINAIKILFSDVVSRLYAFECLSFHYHPEVTITIRENVIRLCSFINDKIPDELDEFKERIKKLQERGKLMNPSGDLDKISNTICSADPKFLGLLDEFERKIGKDEDKGEFNVLLYSEPGLGKESLAQLIYFFNIRSRMDKPTHDRRTLEIFENLNDAYKSKYITWFKKRGIIKDNSFVDEQKWNDRSEKGKNDWHYIVDNMGSIYYEKYINILFGEKNTPGIMTRAHLVSGAVFLDELNTMDRRIASGMLRAIQDPYTIRPNKGKENIKLSLLVIFGSNKSPEKLISDGFNPAFLDRITQLSFRVSPLRERKADIAVIFNRLVRENNKDNKIRFIDLNGLRLLIELPWRKNVRELKYIVEDLFAEREKRMMNDKEANWITFDEIMKCVVKRRII